MFVVFYHCICAVRDAHGAEVRFPVHTSIWNLEYRFYVAGTRYHRPHDIIVSF